jgi:thiol-disulfide isomerase/thioredoxin
MIRTVLATSFVLLSAQAPAAAGAGDWTSWEPELARHSLRGLDGAATTSLSQMRGEVVVVNFWASWCKPCKKELLHLDEWSRSLADRPARIVAVSVDSDPRKAQRFVRESGITLPIYHDGADGLARSLEIPFLPCTVVVDPWGRVVRVSGGGSEEAIRELMGTVRSLLPGESGTRTARDGGVSG